MKKRTKKIPAPARRPPRPSDAELDAEIAAMDRDLDDPQLISGIYNYCDRWCERCPKTAHCLTFRTEQREKVRSSEGSRDVENQEFWDSIGNAFAVVMRMLERDAEQGGLNLDDTAVRKETERALRRYERRSKREGRALRDAAMRYADAAEDGLEKLAPAMRDSAREVATLARLGAGDPGAVVRDIEDALQVVQWYQLFILVKLERAVGSRGDEAEHSNDEFPHDSDGSAKVALLAIDRSMAAWARLRERFESHSGDVILDLLVQLERLRRAVEAEFPRARTFQRPGFD